LKIFPILGCHDDIYATPLRGYLLQGTQQRYGSNTSFFIGSFFGSKCFAFAFAKALQQNDFTGQRV
jgi:hypothetical protein